MATKKQAPANAARPKKKLVMPASLAHIKPGELPQSLLVAVKPYGQLHPLAAQAYTALREAAFAAGINTFKPSSEFDTYRSISLQKQGFLARYQLEPIAGASTRTWEGRTYYQKPGTAPMAAPGSSRHNLGLACDISEASGDRLAWMVANCDRFGFCWEVDSEPWHIFYYPGDKIPAAVKAWKQAKAEASPTLQQG